ELRLPDPSPPPSPTVSLHDALPILLSRFREIERELEVRDLTPNKTLVETLKAARRDGKRVIAISDMYLGRADLQHLLGTFGLDGDRKSTRLNSSHVSISYAVFCLKK